MDFRILGQLEVVVDGRRLDLGGHKQRAALALLLLHANRVVPVDQLVDRLWDGAPPPQAVGTLRAYLSNLRRVVEPGRAPGDAARILVGESGGYVLRIAPEQLDANRFEALVQRARRAMAAGDAPQARNLWEEALGLWRGPALADFADDPFAWADAARLEECRLAAVEEHAEACLACGHHAAVVADLESLVGAHPLRERLRGLLMLALYRCGRQADALRTYEEGRRVLAEELGLDPSPELQALEHAVLTQDRSIDGPRTAAVLLPGTAPAAMLVGRDPEVDRLRADLDEAVSGHGRIALVAGEPGIGKTRLSEALAACAADAGATVVWGAGHEGDGAPPFWPWVQVVRRLVEERDAAEVRDALGRDAGHIAAIVPEVAEVEPAPTPAVTLPADPDLARFRVYDALTRFLLRVSRHTVLVIVLDDLHWADVPSLQLLSFLAGPVREGRLLVVGTYRDAEVSQAPDLADTLASLARQPSVTRLHLRGLEQAVVGDLVRQTTAVDPTTDLVTALHRRTDGNPFFLVELARLYRTTGSLDAVPATVRDVIRHNVNRLPDGSRELLAVAATIGAEFDLGVLAEAGRRSEEEVIALVEPAVTQGVVIDTAQVGRFRFSHALSRDAVYDDLNPLRRARLHGEVGLALERRYRAGNAELVTEVAEHFLRASGLGYGPKAIEYAGAAAEVAVRALAFEQAELLLRKALDLLPTLPPGRDAARTEMRLRMRLASLLFTTKGYSEPDILPALSRALDLGRQVGTREELLAILYGTWGFALGRPDLPMARKIADELLDIGRRTDDHVYRRVGHAAAGNTSVHEGDPLEAAEHLRAGAAFADDGDDASAELIVNEIVLEKHPLVAAHAINGVNRYLLGDEAGALADVRKAHELAQRVGQPFGLAVAHVIECGVHALRRDPHRLTAVAADGMALAREHGFQQWVQFLTVMQAWADALLARPDPRLDRAEAVLAELASSGNGMLQHFLLGLVADGHRQQRRLDQALEVVDRAIEAAESSGERFFEAELHRIRGEILWALGPARAAEALEEHETAVLVARRQRAVALQRRAEERLAQLRRESARGDARS